MRSLTMFCPFRHRSRSENSSPISFTDYTLHSLDSLVCTLLYDNCLKQFLSMKLAALNSRLDFHIDEMVNSVYPHEIVSTGYLHFNPMQQVITSSDPPLQCFNVGYALYFLFHYEQSCKV